MPKRVKHPTKRETEEQSKREAEIRAWEAHIRDRLVKLKGDRVKLRRWLERVEREIRLWEEGERA